MNRRRLLFGSLSGCLGLLAGCSAPFEDTSASQHEPRLEVSVVNALHEPVRATITATRGSTELFSQTYALAPAEGDESDSFVGTPTEIQVSVQDGRTVNRDYTVPPTCSDPELNVTIESDTTLVTNGCVQS